MCMRKLFLAMALLSTGCNVTNQHPYAPRKITALKTPFVESFLPPQAPKLLKELEDPCTYSADKRSKACVGVLAHEEIDRRGIPHMFVTDVVVADLERKTQEVYFVEKAPYVWIQSATPDLSALLIESSSGTDWPAYRSFKSLSVLDRKQKTLTTFLRTRPRTENYREDTGFSDAHMSSNGEWITYVSSDVLWSSRSVNFEIYSINRKTGKHYNITQTADEELLPVITSDGSTIGYVRNEYNGSNIYAYDTAKGLTRLLQSFPAKTDIDANDVRTALEGKKIVKESALTRR
jgi:hypothetical protein